MKSANYNNIFSPTGCIEKEILIRYAKGELDSKEKNAVEKHLVDCPLCTDALEGYMLAGGQIETSALDANIQRLAMGETKTGFRKYYAAAAALAVMVLLSYVVITLLRDVPESRMAITTEKEEVKPMVPAIRHEEKIVSDSEAVIMVEKSPVAPPAGDVQSALTEPAGDELSVAKEEMETAGEMAPVTADNVTYIDNLKVVEPEINVQQSSGAEPESVTQTVKATAAEKKYNAPSAKDDGNFAATGAGYNDRLTDGLALYNKGRYKAAINIFDEILQQQPADENAKFYKGLSNYHLENYREAIRLLEPFHLDPKHPFYAEAEYYIASSLARSGEIRKGEYMLNNIISNKGFNHQQAVEELNKIKQ